MVSYLFVPIFIVDGLSRSFMHYLRLSS